VRPEQRGVYSSDGLYVSHITRYYAADVNTLRAALNVEDLKDRFNLVNLTAQSVEKLKWL
jgi:hypothetical protein